MALPLWPRPRLKVALHRRAGTLASANERASEQPTNKRLAALELRLRVRRLNDTLECAVRLYRSSFRSDFRARSQAAAAAADSLVRAESRARPPVWLFTWRRALAELTRTHIARARAPTPNGAQWSASSEPLDVNAHLAS